MESLERFVVLATSSDITRVQLDHGHVSDMRPAGTPVRRIPLAANTLSAPQSSAHACFAPGYAALLTCFCQSMKQQMYATLADLAR